MATWKTGMLWAGSVAAAVLATLMFSSATFAEQKKRACTNEMMWAYKVAFAVGKKDAAAKEYARDILASSVYSKDVCGAYSFDGEPVIPK